LIGDFKQAFANSWTFCREDACAIFRDRGERMKEELWEIRRKNYELGNGPMKERAEADKRKVLKGSHEFSGGAFIGRELVV
jgi:hypothetical protein